MLQSRLCIAPIDAGNGNRIEIFHSTKFFYLIRIQYNACDVSSTLILDLFSDEGASLNSVLEELTVSILCVSPDRNQLRMNPNFRDTGGIARRPVDWRAYCLSVWRSLRPSSAGKRSRLLTPLLLQLVQCVCRSSRSRCWFLCLSVNRVTSGHTHSVYVLNICSTNEIYYEGVCG